MRGRGFGLGACLTNSLLKSPDFAKNGRTLRYENWDDFGPSTPFSAPC